MQVNSTIFDWTVTDYQKTIDDCQNNVVTPYLLEFLPKDQSILEAGCGTGRFVKYLSDLGYDIEGMEISQKWVDNFNEAFPEYKVKVGDVSMTGYPDGHFGGIISLGVVEHFIEGPEKALKEMNRILKPAGIGIITIPSFNYLRQIKNLLGLDILDFYLRKIYHKAKGMDFSETPDANSGKSLKYHKWPVRGNFFEYRMTKKQFEKELENAGFKIINEVPLEYLGGLYHELGGKFVNLDKPSLVIKIINNIFSKIPFSHNHTHLCVVTK